MMYVYLTTTREKRTHCKPKADRIEPYNFKNKLSLSARICQVIALISRNSNFSLSEEKAEFRGEWTSYPDSCGILKDRK
jgi:hypothetical protein